MATSYSASKFSKKFEKNGVPLIGATIYLVPQSDTYPTNALQLTELGAGVYYYANLPDGVYKVYIDDGAGAVIFSENIWHGSARITGMPEFKGPAIPATVPDESYNSIYLAREVGAYGGFMGKTIVIPPFNIPITLPLIISEGQAALFEYNTTDGYWKKRIITPAPPLVYMTGASFMGEATPETAPSGITVYEPVYVAKEPGTYTNFVGVDEAPLTISSGEVAMFFWNEEYGCWEKKELTVDDEVPIGMFGALPDVDDEDPAAVAANTIAVQHVFTRFKKVRITDGYWYISTPIVISVDQEIKKDLAGIIVNTVDAAPLYSVDDGFDAQPPPVEEAPRIKDLSYSKDAGMAKIGRVLEDILGNLAVSVKDYGAVGDGVTDDTTSIANSLIASNWVNFEPSKTYLFESFQADVANKDMIADGNGATLLRTGDYQIFRFKADELRLVRVNAIADEVDNNGAPVLSKITTAFSHQCVIGDVVSIGSNLNDDIDPVLTRMGEIATVYKVISATELLVHRLEKSFDLTTPADRPNLYRFATNRVQFKNFALRSAPSPLAPLDASMVFFAGLVNPIIENIQILYTSSSGIALTACVGASVKSIYVRYAEDVVHSETLTATSYGVNVSGSSYCVFTNIVGHNTRHVIDLLGTRSGFRGYSAYNQINDCIGFNNTNGSFSLHQGAYRNTFQNCKSVRSIHAFNIRGHENVFSNCESNGDYIGCQVINDQAAGGSWTKGNVLLKTEFIDSVVGAVRISDNNRIESQYLNRCTFTANKAGSFGSYFISHQNTETKVVIDDLTININNDITTPRLILNSGTGSFVINRLTVNIRKGLTLGNYSIFETSSDLNFTINNLEINCPDAANYPEYLIKSRETDVLTGTIYNSKFDGLKEKLHNHTATNQAFVDSYGRGHIVIGDSILTK